MKILLIDAGNTTIDFRSYDTEKKTLLNLYRPETQSLAQWQTKAVQTALKWKQNQFAKIVYASVVPQFSQWIQKFGQEQNVEVFNVQKSTKINTQAFQKFNLEKIGADFIANFHAQPWDDALIISLGTATTIMQIKDRQFQGVIIAPGIRTSLTNLINSAALLKAESFQWNEQTIGTNTAQAISLGTINGHYYFIKSFIDQLKTKQTKIIFTGGNADLVFPGIEKDDYEYVETLIFQGLINLI